jgi:ABC-type antimicrobial peptide transport system permease subunit
MFIEGRVLPPGERIEVSYRVASDRYFETLRIPLRSGRLFSGRDPLEVLINETTARKFFASEDPVGKRLRFGPNAGSDPWSTIVGVVGDIRHFGLDVAAPPEIYRPYAINPLGSPVFAVATDGTVRLETLRATLREVSPEIPIFNTYAMSELVSRTTEHRRFPMLLILGFAVLTLVLAAIGLYGVVAQDAAHRRREFGVRVSLGATPLHVFALLMRQGLRIAAAGLSAGLFVAIWIARYAQSVLFATGIAEPLVWVPGCLTLLGVAALACVAPGLRAARSDPAEALRSE